MKRIFILSMLICFAMICSCQKQDSAAEQQLTQRKMKLDAREKALDERDKDLNLRQTALDERENALAKKEKAAANTRTIPPDIQDQIPDPAQDKAERERRIQQLTAEFRAMMPDPSKMKAEKDRIKQEQLGQGQPALEKLHREKQRVLEMSGGEVSSAVEAASATPSPGPQ